jgi:Na+-transporting methylmalonyl-CoA/oxaloacetate decarboxylase gamma subunit
MRRMARVVQTLLMLAALVFGVGAVVARNAPDEIESDCLKVVEPPIRGPARGTCAAAMNRMARRG